MYILKCHKKYLEQIFFFFITFEFQNISDLTCILRIKEKIYLAILTCTTQCTNACFIISGGIFFFLNYNIWHIFITNSMWFKCLLSVQQHLKGFSEVSTWNISTFLHSAPNSWSENYFPPCLHPSFLQLKGSGITTGLL